MGLLSFTRALSSKQRTTALLIVSSFLLAGLHVLLADVISEQNFAIMTGTNMVKFEPQDNQKTASHDRKLLDHGTGVAKHHRKPEKENGLMAPHAAVSLDRGITDWNRFVGSGSSPPSCISKCGQCMPCTSVLVLVDPSSSMAGYYPEVWRCKCGDELFVP